MMNYTSDVPRSDSELNDLLKRVRLDKDVEDLGGLDYQIGSGGEKLSGGQRQKLGIARLLMSDREYILLDEATSALDAEATEVLQKEIDLAGENRTEIVVTHDLATIVNADKVLVFADGKLVGEGTHEALLASSPVYQELVKGVA